VKKAKKEQKKKDLKFWLVIWLIFVFIGGIVSLVNGEIWYLIVFAALLPALYAWLHGAG
jgi:Flp pilus assembly protein TadB